MISDHGLLSSCGGQQGASNERDFWIVFSGMYKALDSWILTRAPASLAEDLHHHEPRYYIFPYFCLACDLEKLGLVDET